MEKFVVLSGSALDEIVQEAGIVEEIEATFPEMGKRIEGTLEKFFIEVQECEPIDEWTDELGVDLVFIAARVYLIFPDGRIEIGIYDPTSPCHWGDNLGIDLPEEITMAIYNLAMAEVSKNEG